MMEILVFLLGDYAAFVMVKAFSEATPGYGFYGWPLYVAANASILYYFKNKYLR